jgi:SAM-dependent methyltransferase
MSTVTEHYRHLLAKHYVWMFGVSFEEKVAEQKALLERVLAPRYEKALTEIALDLGSGPGFQSIALAELGYSPVIAIDTSVELLTELRERRGLHPVETMTLDLTSLSDTEFPTAAAVAICMGDTLTHLPSRESVEALFDAVFQKLEANGTFLLTFRDLTHELAGAERFLPVQSDANKILTCFLEYDNEQSVLVNDLLYFREDGGWHLEKSSYRKLRLSSDWVASALRHAGFTVERQEPAGRLSLIAARRKD